MDNYVGPYRVLRLINRGGQGSVYLGFDERLQRKVAIKIHDLPGQKPQRRALLREARMVARLESPKIVKVYDVIESANHLAMVMEYVPGCSLRELLVDVRPTIASTLTVAVDMAGALAIARQNHVLHCDLKPGNVLIAENGHAKLTDFGISRPLADGSLARAGSPAAMSPEQYTGAPMDTRSDFFSLGAVLYHMLTGVHPFMPDGQLNVAHLLAGGARPLREVLGRDSEVPEALMDLVEQMLSNDPDKRPRHTRYIRQVLRSLTRDIPLAANKTLGRESRPCFRPELPEDMPVLVPRELGRDARSRLPPANSGTLARVVHWLRGTGRTLRAATASAALAVLGLASWHAVYNTATPVLFSEPVLHYDHGTQLPDAFSSGWLIDELKLAVAEQVGPLQVLGKVGAEAPSVLYSSTVRRPPPPDPRHSFGLILRCQPRFCVLDISRSQGAARYSSQAVLLPNAPFEEWRSALHGATAALFF